MIPHPIVSRRVACAISAETTVDERASIWCLRHHGYASASQIVSSPASSSTRAVSSISSNGSIVSCITPTRKGGVPATRTILPDLIKSVHGQSTRPERASEGGHDGDEHSLDQRRRSARARAVPRPGGG